MQTLRTAPLVVAALLWGVGCLTVTPSRNGRTSVRWLDDDHTSFQVHAGGNAGSTASDMGRRAMVEACRLTRDRGYAYYGVSSFETRGGTGEVQTREEGNSYILNSTGQAVGAIHRPAEYSQYRYGDASLVAVMLSPGSIDMLGGSMEVVDANTCLVHSRPNR